jgi:hypothetical protein
MGEAERNKRQSAREQIAAQQAAARRAESRRRMLIAGGSIVVVLAVVLVFIVIRINSSTPAASSTPVTGTALPASVSNNVTDVPVSTLDAVGPGSILKQVSKPVTAITGAPLTQGGKPELLYIGAEYCPYCAAMRWAMATALSRFGTLSPLRGIHSSPTDVYPSTATLTFYKSGYQSPYLAFTPVENETVSKAPLQATTPEQQAIWERYEPNDTGYPFMDFGNKYMITVIYNPQVLHGKTWAQIASALHDPSSPVAQSADGAANFITASICKMTDDRPASVCSSPAVTAVSSHL